MRRIFFMFLLYYSSMVAMELEINALAKRYVVNPLKNQKNVESCINNKKPLFNEPSCAMTNSGIMQIQVRNNNVYTMFEYQQEFLAFKLLSEEKPIIALSDNGLVCAVAQKNICYLYDGIFKKYTEIPSKDPIMAIGINSRFLTVVVQYEEGIIACVHYDYLNKDPLEISSVTSINNFSLKLAFESLQIFGIKYDFQSSNINMPHLSIAFVDKKQPRSLYVADITGGPSLPCIFEKAIARVFFDKLSDYAVVVLENNIAYLCKLELPETKTDYRRFIKASSIPFTYNPECVLFTIEEK